MRPIDLLALFVPQLPLAHIVNDNGSFLSGLAHPALGFDHLLAMIAVGIISAQLGGRAIWTVPATFVTVMAIGGVLGMAGISILSVEFGIALSVLSLGIAIAAGQKVPVWFAMTFVGVFALFHGHAHGAEMPNLALPILYAAGFLTGTASIHLTGVCIGLVAETYQRGPVALRILGASIAGIGAYLIVS